MIKEKIIKIKISTKKIKIYNDLGYNVNFNDILEIPIEHLQKGYQIMIIGICDSCGKEKSMMYKTYLYCINNSYLYCHENIYYCKKCASEKIKKIMKKKYGVEYAMKSELFKNKAKTTWLKNLGVDHPSKSKKIRSKFNNTMIERYGCKNALENTKIKNKMFLKQFNDNNGMYFVQTESFKEKSKITCLEKYDVEKYLQSEDKKEKTKSTCLIKYGVNHSSQCTEILNKILNTSKKMIKFKDTNLFYQGSYEKNF